MDEREAVARYVQQHGLPQLLTKQVNMLVKSRPENPVERLQRNLRRSAVEARGIEGAAVKSLGRVRGGNRFQVTISCPGTECSADCFLPFSSNDNAGAGEDSEAQPDSSRWSAELLRALEGKQPTAQSELDASLDNLRQSGAVPDAVTLAASWAGALTAASLLDIPVAQYVSDLFHEHADEGQAPPPPQHQPLPMIPVLLGGTMGRALWDRQGLPRTGDELRLMPPAALWILPRNTLSSSVQEALDKAVSVDLALEEILARVYGRGNFVRGGSTGALLPRWEVAAQAAEDGDPCADLEEAEPSPAGQRFRRALRAIQSALEHEGAEALFSMRVSVMGGRMRVTEEQLEKEKEEAAAADAGKGKGKPKGKPKGKAGEKDKGKGKSAPEAEEEGGDDGEDPATATQYDVNACNVDGRIGEEEREVLVGKQYRSWLRRCIDASEPSVLVMDSPFHDEDEFSWGATKTLFPHCQAFPGNRDGDTTAGHVVSLNASGLAKSPHDESACWTVTSLVKRAASVRLSGADVSVAATAWWCPDVDLVAHSSTSVGSLAAALAVGVGAAWLEGPAATASAATAVWDRLAESTAAVSCHERGTWIEKLEEDNGEGKEEEAT